MNFFVFSFLILTIAAGFGMLVFLTVHMICGKNIKYISYVPKNDNDTEYILRTLLFMYPNAVIETTENPISAKMEKDNPRITAHRVI